MPLGIHQTLTVEASQMFRLICLSTLILFLHSTSSKQVYDPNPCSSTEFSSFSYYTCATSIRACQTFIVYRSRQGFDSVFTISALFGVSVHDVLALNSLNDSSQTLEPGRDIIVPIHCSCSGAGFFQSNTSYMVPAGATYTTISCETFSGLVKLPALIQQNLPTTVGAVLTVPLQCACPDINDTRAGFRYLVTYPVLEFDTSLLVATKFGVSPQYLWDQNSLKPFPTINSNTTIIIPLRTMPAINSTVADMPNQDHPLFVPLSPTVDPASSGQRQQHLYVIGSGVGFFAVVLVFGLGFYYKKSRSRKKDNGKLEIVSSVTPSSTLSSLSPDLIAVFSKYSLVRYNVEELNAATKGFSEETKLGASVHKGSFGGTKMVIKKMGYGDARRTIGIHSKINHTNIVKLEGVCYGGSEETFSLSYLVFEYATNGCLRDCLNGGEAVLPWHMRARIAFDVAIGLHYIHHCTVPSYVHMNINSRNILVTGDWRSKIANLGVGSVVDPAKERVDVVVTSEGWIAPEYVQYGLVSPKVDVFAFGVVLLELVSAKQSWDGSFVRDELRFLSGSGGDTGCLDQLRDFVDQRLKDYPVREALCVTVLAKACVEDDPLHRPSMDDILKILARMER